MNLARFLYTHLKGYRFLIVLAIAVTFAQVGCDLVAALPLKFIPSKVSNHAADPACSYAFLDPVLSLFDIPLLDPSLRPEKAEHPGRPEQSVRQPEAARCPGTSSAHPVYTHHSVIGVIVFSLLILLIAGSLSALLSFFGLYLATYIALHLTAQLREQLFDHLQRLSLDWHDRQKKGDLVQRITGNIADLEKLVTDGLVDLLAGSLTLLGITGIMLSISVPYTLIALLITPFMFLLVFSYTSGIKRAARKKARAAGKISDVATEDMHALTVIRAFTLERRENKRFGGYVDTHHRAGMKAGQLQAQFTPLVAVLVVIGTLLVLGVGGYVAAGNTLRVGAFTIQSSSIDVGTLILFLTYLKMLYQPMRDLSKLTTLASNASSGAERIQEVFDQAPEVIAVNVAYNGPQRLRGDITFENVVFGYLKDQPILKGVSHHIPAGHKVALVGYSGSGKTTLVKMIPRFYEIRQGCVKIDGIDVARYPLHILRQNISMVLQDSVLFEGTIRENLEIGRPGATMEQIIDATRKANIHDVIMKLPDGYDTYVREQGSNFSGGQRQRLAIARAILRDTPILILDEPTANLDVEAEAEVMRALNTLITGRTVLTISHRLSTLGKVDEIIVMSAGNIIERGTFKQLKRLGGVFAELLDEQNRYNVDRDDDELEPLVVRSAHLKAIPLPARERVATASLNDRSISFSGTGAIHNPASSHTTAITSAVSRQLSEDIDKLETLKVVSVSSKKSVALVPLKDSVTSQATAVMGSVGKQPPADEGAITSTMTALSPVITSITSKMTALVPALARGKDGAGPARGAVLPSSRARICVFMNGKPIGEYPLEKPSIMIGRYSKSDIQIPSTRVSRYHANLRWHNGAWLIEDADSLNGLTWQGQRISQMVLSDGDRIYLDPEIALQYIEI